MMKKILRYALTALLVVAMLTLSIGVGAAPVGDSALACVGGIRCAGVSVTPSAHLAALTRTKASPQSYKDIKLYAGGIPFGVKFMTEGVIVVGTCDVKTADGKVCPATDAGLRQNDILIKANGTALTDAATLTSLAESCGGNSIEITYTRDGKQATAKLTPALCVEEGKYKTGMYVRDSGAGIGTVTYIVPETCSFGGLGHGICDSDTGKLIPMQRGSVVGVTINGVVKGLSGTPGEVRGYFSSGKTGTLLKNTECGVFGAFASLPDGLMSEPMSIATRNELKVGKAYILSTLDGTTPQKYEVEISDIRTSSMSNKCFTVKVTDQNLLQKSGGIVQGMSGSPIIQDGKLVGAVTHVLINDPTTGYGIFIENMLNQAG